jgi:AraC family transcriptional regulator
MTLKTLERPAVTVIGLTISTQPMSPDIPALWPKFVARIPEIQNPLEPEVSYGVMRYGEGPPQVLHYMAAVPVAPTNPVPAGMTRLTLPAGTYAEFRYPLSGLKQGFCEIYERLLPASDYAQTPGPFFERYGADFDPGDPQSAVEIYLPVRPRSAMIP